MKWIVASPIALALVLIAMEGSAQERQDLQQRREQPRVEQAQAGGHGDIESKLALWLATCNNVQIEVSQLAAQKASDPAVKQFAQQVLEGHTQLNTQLAQFVSPSDRDKLRTGAAVRTGAAEGISRPARTPGQTEARAQVEPQLRGDAQRRIETPSSRSGQDPFQEIASEAARRSTQMITSLLQEKEGKEFDMCYTGLQVFAHINFVAELEAMEGHGSEQFQQVVTKAAETTKSHLESAKQLAKKIGESAGGTERVTRRPEQPLQEQERP